MFYDISEEQKQFMRFQENLKYRKDAASKGFLMKSYTEQLKELEEVFIQDINKSILNLISVKFSKNISEIAKVQIREIIQDAINETIWIDEIKENISTWVKSYIESIEHEKHQLGNRMDFLEQRLLDFMHKIETEYSKKAVFAHLAGEL
jgi:hypothetical protein